MHSISKKAKQEYMRIKAVACVVAAFCVYFVTATATLYNLDFQV